MFGRLGLGSTTVDAPEAYRLAQEDDALLLDVREPMEYTAGHAPGATLVPLGQLQRQAANLPKDRTIVAVCASGNRSGAATRFLAQEGFDVVNLRGGMLGWQQAGLPVETGR